MSNNSADNSAAANAYMNRTGGTPISSTGLPPLQQIGAASQQPSAITTSASSNDSLFNEQGLGNVTINATNPQVSYPYQFGSTRLDDRTAPTTQASGTVDELLTGFYQMTPDELMTVQSQLYAGGFYGKLGRGQIAWGKFDDATWQAYHDAVIKTAMYVQAGRNMSFEDVLNEAKDIQSAVNPNGPSSKTATSKSVNYTNPTQARGIAFSTLEKELGRAPTDAEYSSFLAALNAAEGANPNVTTQTTNADGTQQTTTSSGGVDPTMFAHEWDMQHNGAESGAYRAATDYYNAALAALGPGGR